MTQMNFTGAGFIIFTPDFRVLLVQDAKTKKWGFPKGHREDTDVSDLENAQRELLEETGIAPNSYTVYEHPFRVIRGSSSYVFRYAIMNTTDFLGEIQCRGEISGIQWVSLVQFYLNPECVNGNKYLRTWITDIVSHADRKTYTTLQMLINRTLGVGVGVGNGEAPVLTHATSF
jgi:8-oxo-dGTP pyrophosphatase MutT (NUDIX family)